MTIEEIVAAMTAIIDGAEGRDLTDDEVAKYEEHEAQLQAAQRSEQIRARQAAYASVPPAAVHVAPKREEADTPEAAFEHYLRTGQVNQDLTRMRGAQSEGTGSEGGYLVPEGFRQKLIERMKAFGGIAAVAEEIVTETGNNMPWPTVDDTANEGEIVNEGGSFSSSADITFGDESLGAYSYSVGGSGSTPIRISLELVQDAAFDIQGLAARLLATRLRRVQARHLALGTGANQPRGLVYGLTGIKAAANTGLTYDDLVNYTHSVDPAYRELGNCRWVFNDNTLGIVEKIKDSHGDPIFRPADADMATATSAGRLLNYPVTIDQSMPDLVANSETVNWGAFGDIREGYVVRRVRDVQVIVNPWTRASNRQIEVTAWARMDAIPQNLNAYKALTGKV